MRTRPEMWKIPDVLRHRATKSFGTLCSRDPILSPVSVDLTKRLIQAAILNTGFGTKTH